MQVLHLKGMSFVRAAPPCANCAAKSITSGSCSLTVAPVPLDIRDAYSEDVAKEQLDLATEVQDQYFTGAQSLTTAEIDSGNHRSLAVPLARNMLKGLFDTAEEARLAPRVEFVNSDLNLCAPITRDDASTMLSKGTVDLKIPTNDAYKFRLHSIRDGYVTGVEVMKI